MVANALISCHLDYCNSLFRSLSSKKITRLQNIQNCLACFVSGASRFSHITPTLKSLHWLPVKQRIIFILLIYQYLATGKPKYFAPYLSLYTYAIKIRHSNPEKMFLKVSFYSSSVHKSKVHFNKCFSYDAGMICHWKFELLPHYKVSKGDLKLICFRSLFLPRISYYQTPIVPW